jgi:hypothetical protein
MARSQKLVEQAVLQEIRVEGGQPKKRVLFECER